MSVEVLEFVFVLFQDQFLQVINVGICRSDNFKQSRSALHETPKRTRCAIGYRGVCGGHGGRSSRTCRMSISIIRALTSLHSYAEFAQVIRACTYTTPLIE